MIADATARAREAAEQFARDSRASLGGIRRANQGVFEILPRDQAPGISPGGADVDEARRAGHPPVLMDADAWFDRRDASGYQLYEQSVQLMPNEVLTLLVLKDQEMLEEVESRSSWSWRR